MNDILIIHMIVGSVLLAVSILVKVWPPKKINHFYGYRSARSMKSQLMWDVANRYSASLLMWAGVSNVLVHIVSYVLVGEGLSVLIPIGYYLVFILVSIFLIEKRLKARM